MRVLLFTGKGGVGKTTIAAATALRAAESGTRTLVCSTDPAHSLGDALDVELGDTVVPVTGRLDGQELDARDRLEESWGSIRSYLVSLFQWAGAEGLDAEELAVIPGLDEVFALAELRSQAESGEYDLIVVDCAPTAETLRLLSLPDVLGWYMDRIFPAQRAVTRAVRPIMNRMVRMPTPDDGVFDNVRHFYDRLDGVRDLLTDGSVSSARLVVTPERMVVAEARRTFTYLSLFGYHVDAVIANRVLPDAVSDPWFKGWRDAQAEHMDTIRTDFEPVPVLTADLAEHELVGIQRLGDFGATLYDESPARRLSTVEPMRLDVDGDTPVLSLWLPFTDKDDLDLGRSGDELYIGVDSYRRAVMLPDSLRRRSVTRAHIENGRLNVEFGEGLHA